MRISLHWRHTGVSPLHLVFRCRHVSHARRTRRACRATDRDACRGMATLCTGLGGISISLVAGRQVWISRTEAKLLLGGSSLARDIRAVGSGVGSERKGCLVHLMQVSTVYGWGFEPPGEWKKARIPDLVGPRGISGSQWFSVKTEVNLSSCVAICAVMAEGNQVQMASSYVIRVCCLRCFPFIFFLFF